MSARSYEVAVIGGGIVGLATALCLVSRYRLTLVVLEAEPDIASHQTGHNSGVIHSGLYYKPGSLKARNCVAGREALYRFCAAHGIPHERCGKVVVASRPEELPILEELERRGQANGLRGLQRLGPEALREREPYAQGLAALWVPETGIVDYRAVARKYRQLLEAEGGQVQTRAQLLACRRAGGNWLLETTAGDVTCRGLINCAGLYSDRVARLCGLRPPVQIVPFRGEYYELKAERSFLVRNLIYPVPDPRFPFLGVHFTRRLSGGIEAGPNAVLAFSRRGYRWRDVSLRDTWEMFRYGGFWRLARKYARTGLAEMYRSLWRPAFARALQRLVPAVQAADLLPGGSGVRAQALSPEGTLVDDFVVVRAAGMIHVLNAPSPAATASLSIGQTLAAWAAEDFSLASRPGGGRDLFAPLPAS